MLVYGMFNSTYFLIKNMSSAYELDENKRFTVIGLLFGL